MGNNDSKDTEQSGNQDVVIIQNQEVHTGMLTDHEMKLNILMIMVAIQLLITLGNMVQKLLQKQALKAAKSVATLDV